MKWPLTFYVDKLKKPHIAGTAKGPVIRILKSYKNDEGLYQHELTHVKQWFCLPIIHNIIYNFSEKYRYWCELKAYRRQLKYSPGREELFATYICDWYKLDVEKEDVIKDLKE